MEFTASSRAKPSRGWFRAELPLASVPLNSMRLRLASGGKEPDVTTALTTSIVLPSSFCSVFLLPTLDAMQTMLLLHSLRFVLATRVVLTSWLLKDTVWPICSFLGGPYCIRLLRLSRISVSEMAWKLASGGGIAMSFPAAAWAVARFSHTVDVYRMQFRMRLCRSFGGIIRLSYRAFQMSMSLPSK
jgi:hypothetical protein